MTNLSKNKLRLDKLTKAEIVEGIHSHLLEHGSSVHKREILSVIELFFEQIKTAMVSNRVVELRGFGTFELKLRKGREKARNPRTGETLPVETHHVATFRPGKELKKSVWPVR